MRKDFRIEETFGWDLKEEPVTVTVSWEESPAGLWGLRKARRVRKTFTALRGEPGYVCDFVAPDGDVLDSPERGRAWYVVKLKKQRHDELVELRERMEEEHRKPARELEELRRKLERQEERERKLWDLLRPVREWMDGRGRNFDAPSEEDWS